MPPMVYPEVLLPPNFIILDLSMTSAPATLCALGETQLITVAKVDNARYQGSHVQAQLAGRIYNTICNVIFTIML